MQGIYSYIPETNHVSRVYYYYSLSPLYRVLSIIHLNQTMFLGCIIVIIYYYNGYICC
jgi:hypothetical protein